MQRFDNKVVIVTGGGAGIGRATAAAFAREGAQVVVADVNESGGNETIAIIKAAGGKATFVHTDVCKADSVNTLVEETVSVHGHFDVYFRTLALSMALSPVSKRPMKAGRASSG